MNTPRGATRETIRLAARNARRIALIGDASAAIDAISGDGLALAFQQAAALGEALQPGRAGAVWNRGIAAFAERPFSSRVCCSSSTVTTASGKSRLQTLAVGTWNF